MKICLSHGGITTYDSQDNVEEVLIGTVDGVYSLQKTGNENWKIVRNGLSGCHVHAIMTEPSTGLVFVGVRKGSLYVTENDGKTWELTDNDLTQKDVYSLNFAHQYNGNVRLYVGTEPAHLYQSDNLGKSWQEVVSMRSVPSVSEWTFPSPPHEAHVKCIAFESDNPKIIYVCIEQGGLLKSEDGGESWNEIHGFDTALPFEVPDGLAANDVHRLVLRPSDAKWLCTSGGVGVCRSLDGGATWEHLTTPYMRIGYPDALVFHPKKHDLGFMAGARFGPLAWRNTHDGDSAIARTQDGGLTWEILQSGLPDHMRGNVAAMSIHVNGETSTVFFGTTDGDVYYSTDEGNNWLHVGKKLPPISKGRHYLTLQEPEKSRRPDARM
jgi:photosystem II stability/assembly factor-like uncharacterized protein